MWSSMKLAMSLGTCCLEALVSNALIRFSMLPFGMCFLASAAVGRAGLGNRHPTRTGRSEGSNYEVYPNFVESVGFFFDM